MTFCLKWIKPKTFKESKNFIKYYKGSTSEPWILWCLLRVPIWLKAFSHWEHWYGFSPVWVLWCFVRVPIWLKAFPHWEHWYGFSPVWILWCFLRADMWLKTFPHWEHSCGFFPVCVIICSVRCERWGLLSLFLFSSEFQLLLDWILWMSPVIF